MIYSNQSLSQLEKLLAVPDSASPSGTFLFKFIIYVNVANYDADRASGFANKDSANLFKSACEDILSAMGEKFSQGIFYHHFNQSGENIRFYRSRIEGYGSAAFFLKLIGAIDATNGIINRNPGETIIAKSVELLDANLMRSRLVAHTDSIRVVLAVLLSEAGKVGINPPNEHTILRSLRVIPAFSNIIDRIGCIDTINVIRSFFQGILDEMVADGSVSYDDQECCYFLIGSTCD